MNKAERQNLIITAIQQNKKIRLSVCEQYSSYGTPEELNKMLNQTK